MTKCARKTKLKADRRISKRKKEASLGNWWDRDRSQGKGKRVKKKKLGKAFCTAKANKAGYTATLTAGKGCIWVHFIIWAGALRLETAKTHKITDGPTKRDVESRSTRLIRRWRWAKAGSSDDCGEAVKVAENARVQKNDLLIHALFWVRTSKRKCLLPSFLVACTRLYNPLCPSVGRSVRLSVTLSF